jgi:hypothetical protein
VQGQRHRRQENQIEREQWQQRAHQEYVNTAFTVLACTRFYAALT